MSNRDGEDVASSRIAREIARERQERALHDEARAHLDAQDEFRIKDVRERMDITLVKRPARR